MAEPVRLQRYLASAGVAARRKAEDLITAGRVTVNGKVVTVLGTKVDPDKDQVEVDGEAVVALEHFYVLFNKPKGCITAVTDDRGRPTVMDYLPNLPVPVKPVGRLDFYTEGVLLLTNDGELAARLLAPASHVPKTYHVKVHGSLTPEDIKALRDGVQLDDGTVTLPAEIEVLPGESKHTWLGITIHEGKHRQIHRMIEAVGYYVDKLQRVAFANLTFHGLRVGDARELKQQELNELRDLVDLDHSAVARGRWKASREATDIPRRARAKARAEAEEKAALAGAPVTLRATAKLEELGYAEPEHAPGPGGLGPHAGDDDDDRADSWGWGGDDPTGARGAGESRSSERAGGARGGFGGRRAGDSRAGERRGARAGVGARGSRGDERGGTRAGFGARGAGDSRGGERSGARAGFGARGPGGATRAGGSRGGDMRGFGNRNSSPGKGGAASGRGSGPGRGPGGAGREPGGPGRGPGGPGRGPGGPSRGTTGAKPGAGGGTKRGGQGRTFGKRGGPQR